MERHETERQKIDAGVSQNLSDATGAGYYSIMAARLIIAELRVFADEIAEIVARQNEG